VQSTQTAEETYAFTEAAVLKARQEPVWFLEEVLNIKHNKRDAISWQLDKWQKELIEAVADIWRSKDNQPTRFNHEALNKLTVRAMHGPGKTFGIAAIMHWFNFCFPGLIVATAPKEKQLKTRLWPAFRKILNRANSEYRALLEVTETKIIWCEDPDWSAQAETASAPENIAGYHGDYLLVVVDEASGVREDLYPAIEGAIATGVFVVLILIGNPTRNSGTFFMSHNTKLVMKYYYKLHISLDKTTRVSKKWVHQMEDKYGKDSPIVAVRCYGNFAASDKLQLIANEWLNDAVGKEFDGDGSIPKIRVSIDVADGGIDSSIVSVGAHYENVLHLIKQHVFNFSPSIATPLLAKAAIRIYNSILEKYPGSEGDFVVDTAGVGTGTAGLLLEKGYPVILYKGGAGSDDPTQWANRRTQSYICYRDALRDGHVVIEEDYCDPEDWEDFYAQHASIKTKEGDRVETLETKKEMVSRGIKSPDMPDSIKQQYSTTVPTLTSKASLDILNTFPTMVDQNAW